MTHLYLIDTVTDSVQHACNATAHNGGWTLKCRFSQDGSRQTANARTLVVGLPVAAKIAMYSARVHEPRIFYLKPFIIFCKFSGDMSTPALRISSTTTR